MQSRLIFYFLNIILITLIPNIFTMFLAITAFICFCLFVELFPNYFQNAFTPNSQALIWVYLKLFFPIYIYSYAERLYEDITTTKALAITITFYFIFFIGLNSRLGMKINRFIPKFYFLKDKTSINKKVAIAICLYLISLLLLLFSYFKGINHFIGSEISGSILNVFYTIAVDIKLYILVLLIYWCFIFKNYYFLLFLLALEIMMAFLDGGRSAFLKPILLLLFVGTYCNNYLRVSFHGFINLMVTALVLIVPLLTLYKEALHKLLVETDSTIINWKNSFNALHAINFDASYVIYIFQQSFIHFAGMFDGLQRVALKVPEVISFQYGSTFLTTWLIGLIPRFFWPDKPVITPGRYFSVVVFDHNSEINEDGVSQGIGMVAETYLNFGFWGLLFIFFIGVYVKFFWVRVKSYNTIEKNEMNLLRWYFFIMKVSLVLQFNLSTFWIGTLREAIIFYLFLCIITLSLPKLRL